MCPLPPLAPPDPPLGDEVALAAGGADDRKDAHAFGLVGDALTEDEIDEAFAFGLLADALIRTLDLRAGCRELVLAELRRERALVLAWLGRPGRGTREDWG
jgi:hypothetical protein